MSFEYPVAALAWFCPRTCGASAPRWWPRWPSHSWERGAQATGCAVP